MIVRALVAAVALLAIPGAGWPLTRLLGLRGPLAPAACWLLGSGLLTLLMMSASALRVPYSRPVLALCWLIAALGSYFAGLWVHPVRRRPDGAVGVRATDLGSYRSGGANRRLLGSWPARLHSRYSLTAAVLFAICVFQVTFSFLQAVRVPLGSFDSWSLWEFKGRHFWLDGGLTAGFLHDQAAIFAHPAYPPLIPLLITWVYTWIGAADPVMMKPLFPAFFLSLLLAFYAALRPRFGPYNALLGTALLALVPRMAEYAGTGLADVPLVAALVCAAAGFMVWFDRGEHGALLAAGLFLGVALLIKRDAIFFALAGLPSIVLLTWSPRVVLRVALPALVVAAPWYAYVRLTSVPDRDFLALTPQALLAHSDRLGEIARLFSLNLLATDEWSVLWYVFFALLLAGIAGRRLRAPLLLLPVLAPLALYVVSLSLSAWPDYTLHVRTSLDRLILVTTPFALWFIAEQLRPPGCAS